VCTRGSNRALLGGPSTSPLEATNLAFRPILSRLSIRALALGAACFIALEAAANWLPRACVLVSLGCSYPLP